MAAHGAHFDALYEASADPWDYETSPSEAAKRRAVRAALGPGPVGSGLEIGCGTGHMTEVLASHFMHLLAIDGAAAAVRLAFERLARRRHVRFEHARMPDGFPIGTFDAVVASEVLYYLPRPALVTTLRCIESSLRPGGRLVVVNALAGFSDREVGHLELAERLRWQFGPPVRTVAGRGWRLDRFVS